MELTIVCIAYNREDSLSRLVGSLQSAHYPVGQNVRLLISIDKSDNDKVLEFANNVHWNHGPKEVIAHPKNLGLREHIFSCIALTEKYDNVVLFEDDCFVSPYFVDYTQKALSFYKGDDNVCGISLYSYDHCEFVRMPFVALDDGFDNYFMQVPSSLGQAFNKRMWLSFKSAMDKGETEIGLNDKLPECLQKWTKSWKKDYFKYMKEQGKYFVYSRTSYSTNFGDIGENFKITKRRYQVSLMVGDKGDYRFSNIQESKSIYDGFYEPEGRIFGEEFEGYQCDFFGYKNPKIYGDSGYISLKNCKNPKKTFDDGMYPQYLSLIFNKYGDGVNVGKASDFECILSSEKRSLNPSFQKVDAVIQKEKTTVLVETYMKKTWEYKIGRIFTLPIRIFKK